MRTLERNKLTFYYATYVGKTELIDKDGNHTAEHIPEYSAWKPCKANISPAKGNSVAELFGNDVNYDRVIVMDDPNFEIDENTVLAIDIAPNERKQTTDVPIFDYVVTRVARSINFVSYAVAKVKTQ